MNDIAPLLEGLKLIDGGSCECYVGRHGPGYFCFDNGKTAPAEFGADRACDSCIAHRALERYEETRWPSTQPERLTVTIEEITRTAEAIYAQGALPDGMEWVPWWPTFTTVDEEPLTTPVFGPPDLGTRECPQPWKPGWGLDDFAVRLGSDWIKNSRPRLYCLRCNRPASGTTIHAGTLLSWLVDIAIEHSHDCESR